MRVSCRKASSSPAKASAGRPFPVGTISGPKCPRSHNTRHKSLPGWPSFPWGCRPFCQLSKRDGSLTGAFAEGELLLLRRSFLQHRLRSRLRPDGRFSAFSARKCLRDFAFLLGGWRLGVLRDYRLQSPLPSRPRTMPSSQFRIVLNREILNVALATPPSSLNRPNQI